ncbi:ComEA family DNA-binding protein [Salinibacterium sp. ZJ70]|uniref:ComEA family DNA-binding protein n=1 Tax=Salinibacterium sp. ZJ70 TaxID=2708084 RepID=UPI001CD7A5AF|nr:ComEA family DNA-binding protein [Salinibacterium sp. ZJ70]
MALVIVLAGAAIAVLTTALAPRGQTHDLPAASMSAQSAHDVAVAEAGIIVHVAGEVGRPGVYELRAGDRVIDAVASAGGLTPDADPAAVNLARPLTDGEQLVVPAEGDEASASVTPGLAHDGRVDLNTADSATLQTLPRIGPAMADRIIQHRTAHGPFVSADDLLSVSGIGSKTLEALRPLVAP